MPKSIKIILIIFTLLIAGRNFLTHPNLAQALETVQDGFDVSGSDVDQNLTKFTGESLNSLFIHIGGAITGAKTKTGEQVTVGVIPTVGGALTAMLVKPPVSSGEYIADVLRNTGLAPQAYAQGIGFSSLTPVLQIWKAFRNLSYFFFIIMFVVIGFMIMFRTKISQNAVVTIQEALPRIIIALILITFSYAIAGFVVDLIYLVIFIVTGLFETFGIFTNPGGGQTARNLIFGKNIISLGFSLLIGTEEVAGEAAQAVTSILNEAFGGWAGVISFITTPLAYVIIAIAIIVGLFRTFFALISAYVGIVLSTIFAPIQLLLHAYPGNNAFGKWFQGLIANAAVFPTAAIMLFLGAALVGGQSKTSSGDNIFPIQDNIGWNNNTSSAGWVPPLIMGGSQAQTGTNAIRAIIGLGMIMLLPEVVKMVHEALQYKGGTITEAAMKNAKAGASPITAPLGMVASSAVGGVGQTIGSGVVNRWQTHRAGVRVAKREAELKAQAKWENDLAAEKARSLSGGSVAPPENQNLPDREGPSDNQPAG